MRTTLDIDAKLLEDVVEATGEKSKSRAVAKALRLYVRQKAIDDIRASAGSIVLEDLSSEQVEAESQRIKLLDELRKP